MKQVNVHEAKTHLSRLIEDALEGEEVIIARDGEPLVQLKPLKKVRPRKGGQGKGLFTIPANFDEPDAEIIGLFEVSEER